VIAVAERQLTLKLVYCGPLGGGKTTNLEALQELIAADHHGTRVTLEGQGDRTPFFDLLPVFFHSGGVRVRLELIAVPGKAEGRMTRRAVLRGADGVVFVADSNPKKLSVNQYAFAELQDELKRLGTAAEAMPLVTQFNKRDIRDALDVKPFQTETAIEAIASRGVGVRETLLAVAEMVWLAVDKPRALFAEATLSAKDFRSELAALIAKH
jgi:signal recognition particle receptor subunit beta